MAEINLLKQTTAPQNDLTDFLPWVNKILIVVFLVLVGYYAWLLISIKKVEKDIASTQATIAQSKNEILGAEDRKELLTRQQQLKQLDQLIDKHVYWSSVLPELAKSTLKNAHVVSFKAQSDGTINMSGTVPDIDALDKFLQVFDLPQFNKNFNNVRITGITNSQDGGTVSTKFDLTMKYNQDLLKSNQNQK